MKKYAIYVGLFVLTVSAGVLASDFTYSVPTAGVTPGPTWASQISTALNILKTHTHTGAVTEGPQLGTASIVEDATHQMNNNALTEVDHISFRYPIGGTAANNSFFVSGGELYWMNNSGSSFAVSRSSMARLNATLETDTTVYISPWGSCTFTGTFGITANLPEYDETAGFTWDAYCSVPVNALDAGSEITSVALYFTTTNANCDIDSSIMYITNTVSTTNPSASETKTNENIGTGSVTVTFSTNLSIDSDTLVSFILSPGNAGANCDDLVFRGYLITYNAAENTSKANSWNY